jgi:RNA polymerase sigma factor (sigma-70 family)
MTHTTIIGGDGPYDLEREATLVEKLKQREPEAWKHFTATYQTRLQSAISRSLAKYRLPLDRQDDIEQKTWMTVFQKIDSFVPEHRDSLYYWLVKIQHNHVRNLHREPVAVDIEENHVEAEGELPAHFHANNAHNPEAEFIQKENRQETWQALEMALQSLTAREREIIMRRLVHKEDVEMLAAIYNVKVQTIYQITANTKRKIGNYLLASDLFLRAHSDRTGKESKTWKK